MSDTPNVEGMRAAAGPRELYLLIAGVVLGMLLGPAVLGRLAPQRSAAMFPSVQAARAQIDAFDRNLADLRRQLAATGVTETATVELDAQLEPQRRELAASERAARRASGRLPAVILALAALMVIEAAAGPSVARRLIPVRYGVIALWLALLLAQPEVIMDLPVAFAGLVLVVALAAGFVPLRRQTADEPAR